MKTLASTLTCMAGLGSLFLSSSSLLRAVPTPHTSPQSQVEAIRLATSLQQSGKPDAAVDVLDTYLKDHPDDLEVHVTKGRYLAFGRRFAEAVQEFENVLQREPQNVPATLGMAKVRSWEGDFPTALDLYDRILKRSPYLYDARVGKAFTLMWMGEKQQALELFRWAARLHPLDPEVKQALAETVSSKQIAAGSDAPVGSGRSPRPVRTPANNLEISSFPEPISVPVVLSPVGRFPLMATVAVSSVGILLCGTLMFLWKTQQPFALPTMQPTTMEVPVTVIPLPEPVRRSAPESNPVAGATPKILIVEGNANVLEFERAVFSGAGLQVAAAASGVEALRLLREGPYALAVLDSHITGEISCVDLLNAIRKYVPELHSHLVLTTSCTADAVRLRNATSHRVLSKPLKMSDLLSVLPTLEGSATPHSGEAKATQG